VFQFNAKASATSPAKGNVLNEHEDIVILIVVSVVELEVTVGIAESAFLKLKRHSVHPNKAVFLAPIKVNFTKP
jgi:hypothetical protein